MFLIISYAIAGSEGAKFSKIIKLQGRMLCYILYQIGTHHS